MDATEDLKIEDIIEDANLIADSLESSEVLTVKEKKEESVKENKVVRELKRKNKDYSSIQKKIDAVINKDLEPEVRITDTDINTIDPNTADKSQVELIAKNIKSLGIDVKDLSEVKDIGETKVEENEVDSLVEDKVEVPSVPAVSNHSTSHNSVPVIANDPEDLLAANLDPKDIAKQMFSDPTRNDTLYDLVKNDESSSHIFKQVLKEIAEELAFLKAARKISFLTNSDISQTSTQRVKALQSLVSTITERDKLNSQLGGKIDFRGDRFEKVVGFFLETVKGAFEKSGIPDQFNDIFFVQLAQDLEGFEKTVDKIYYGKIDNPKVKK